MTKITYAIFVTAVILLVLAAIFQMLVGLIYAFVVTKRDLDRSRFVDRSGNDAG